MFLYSINNLYDDLNFILFFILLIKEDKGKERLIIDEIYKQENDFLFLMLGEILDKTYILKIILFRQDYDIIALIYQFIYYIIYFL